MAKREPRRRGPKPTNFSEIGTTGLKVYAGIVQEEFLPALKGTKAVKVYREMRDNDPTVGAVMFAIEMLMRQVEWKVVSTESSVGPSDARDGSRPLDPSLPADSPDLPLDPSSPPPDETPSEEPSKKIGRREGDANADPRAVFLGSCMNDMSDSWGSFITEVMSMLTYGWSWHEIVYKRREGQTGNPRTQSKFDDGLIGWRKLPIRAQDSLSRWVIGPDGGIKAMIQQSDKGGTVEIPLSRSLLFRTSVAKDNPEGRSALRNCYRPWYFKKKIEEIEGIGLERDLAGLPMMTAPEGLDLWNDQDALAVSQRQLAEDIVRSIRRDEQEGILKPFGWEIQLLSSGGRRTFDTNAIIGRYDQRIAMTVLADFIQLGHSNKFGSFALSKSKTTLFNTAMNGWMNMIRDVMNQHAVPQLLALNGMELSDHPRLDHAEINVPDIEAIGSYLKDLNASGMTLFPNPVLEEAALRAASLPVSRADLAGRSGQPDEENQNQENNVPIPGDADEDVDEDNSAS